MTEQIMKQHPTALTVIGVIMIILGFIAILTPIATTFAMPILLGFLLLIVGFMQLIYAFSARGLTGSFALNILIGILAIIVGALFLANPIPSVFTLTTLLMIFLIISGIFNIIGAFSVRPRKDWGWKLLSGVIALILGFLIGAQWPFSALWIIGLYFGIALLISGWTMLFAGTIKSR